MKILELRVEALEAAVDVLAGHIIPVESAEIVVEWEQWKCLRDKLDTRNTAITVAINRLSAMYKLPSYNRKHTVKEIIAELKEARDG